MAQRRDTRGPLSVELYFHAIKLGLTATPTDHIDHDTFQLFDCAANDPTFAYSYEEAIAHDPAYRVRGRNFRNREVRLGEQGAAAATSQ